MFVSVSCCVFSKAKSANSFCYFATAATRVLTSYYSFQYWGEDKSTSYFFKYYENSVALFIVALLVPSIS